MTFTGFAPAAARFFTGLAGDNSKEFFEAHRQEYTDLIRQPLEDLLGEAQEVYGEGRVTRPNRDVRFSPDKSPYKTNASMWAVGTVGGVHLSVSSEHLAVGGGVYEPSRDQLDRARTAIDSVPLAASSLEKIVETLTADGFEMAGPSLKTAPHGYDRDDPHIELLRLKHYAALKLLPVTAEPAEVWAAWKSVEPLIAWGEEYVKPDRP